MFDLFIESWILLVSYKVNVKLITLQETRSIHDSIKIPEIEFISEM